MIREKARQGDQRFAPRVAAPDSAELLRLPLGRAQLERVLGPSRRAYRVSERRY